MNADPQKDLFKRAAEIASVVPEPMQDAAFQRALDMLQEEEAGHSSRRSSPKRSQRTSTETSIDSKVGSTKPDDVLIEGIDRTKHTEVADEPKVLERALHILKIAHDEFGIDGLSANEIARVLTEKFRIRTTRQRVNQVLDSATTLVDRASGAGRRGARYRIMAPGERHLAKPRDEGKDRTDTTSRKSTSQPRRAARKQAKSKGPSATSQRRRRSVGPRAAIDGLLSDGYLDEPRTIGDVRDYLESKKGRTFKVTDISPTLTRMLRDGSLDREKTEAGQYEYQRK